jgi:hypothetical protein
VKKALFIDHAFHQKTRSADFFIDIVRQGFEVEVYYLTPDNKADVGVLTAAAEADVVLLWQMDFLAPVFLALGKPTIVIPMFDGSWGMPDLHWLFAGRARFFNFSLRLNERIRMLGGETMLLRYFPPAVSESELPRFDRLNAFFWQRRPDHGVHYNYIISLIGTELDGFHLHNAPDIPGSFRLSHPSDAPYKFTESTWFNDKAAYQARLASCNIFIAPRVAEGIGMALLEAMSRGMLVLAHDAPTNNEYVSNGLNGILFNKDVPHGPIQIREDAAKMGRMAWKTVVEGHQRWLESHAAILDWIDGAKSGPVLEIDLEPFFNDLWYSYYGSLPEYELFLRRHLGVMEKLSPVPFDQTLDLLGEASGQHGGPISMRECFLDESGLLDLTLADDRFIGSGWSSTEPEWRWALGTSSELHFSGFENISNRVRARFIASALPELGKWVQCTISLNGALVFDGRVTPGWKEYEFSFDADLLKAENRMTLVFDKAKSIPADRRKMSVCFKSFRFSADLGQSSPGIKLTDTNHKDLFRPGTWRRLFSRA